MSTQLKKVLRAISKVVLVLAGVFVLGYVGYCTYLSIQFKPARVRVTNVTSSSATVSWVTDYPMKGVVYYKEKDSFLPGPLGWIGSEKAWDDRDVSGAETKCVEDFNADMEVSEDFTVDMEGYDCSEVKVSKVGQYYTHHVTLKNLDSEEEYYFRVGDGVWGWNGDVKDVTTFAVLDTVKEPLPVFGKIGSTEGEYSDDAMVYVQFTDGSESEDSMWLSSTTNSEGGWYVDAANALDVNGEYMALELGQDMLKANAQYMNSDLSDDYDWVFGYFDGAYPEILVVSVARANNGNLLVQNADAYSYGCWYSGTCGTSPKTTTPATTTPTTTTTATVKATVPKVEEDKKDNGYAKVVQPSSTNTSTEEKEEAKAAVNTKGFTKAVSEYAGKVGGDYTQALIDLGYCNNTNQCAANLSAMTGVGLKEAGMNNPTKDGGGDKIVEYKLETQTNSDGSTKQFWNAVTVSSAGGNSNSPILLTLEVNTNVGQEWGDVSLNGVSLKSLLSGNSAVLNGLVTSTKSKICFGGIGNVSDDCDLVLTPTAISFDEIVEGMIKDTNTTQTEVDEMKVFVGKLTDMYRNAGVSSEANNYGDLYDQLDNWLLVRQKDELLTALVEKDKSGSFVVNVIQNILGDRKLNINKKVFFADKKTNLSFNLEKETIVCIVNCPSFMKSGNTYTLLDFTEKMIANDFDDDLLKFLDSSTQTLDSTVSTPSTQDSVSYEDFIVDEIGGDRVVWDQDSNNLKSKSIDLRVNSQETIIQYNASSEKIICLENCPDGIVTDTEYSREDFVDGLGNLQDDFILKVFDMTKDQLGENDTVIIDEPSSTNLLNSLVKGAYAQESDSLSNSYYYLPEYGFYTISMSGVNVVEDAYDSENTVNLFYVEVNGEDGLQMPADIDNPQVGDDLVLKSSSLEIKYAQTSEEKTLNLKAGINIISFEDILALSEDDQAATASDLITWAKKQGVDMQVVTHFNDGKWSGGVHCEDENKDNCTGNDFSLIPGEGYLVIMGEDANLTVPVYGLQSSIPIAFSQGWNLVGIHGYSKAFTARTLIDSVNSIDGLTADNVSWWPTSKSKYEGLQVTDGTAYGLDFSLSSSNGYFVRINEFEPSSSDCKSIIWHDGGDLNGTCGNSKTIF